MKYNKFSESFDLEKIIDVLLGKRIFIGDRSECELVLNYLKTIDDITNWLVSLSQYYELEIKIVNMKHPKYKEMIKLINLTTEHGIFQRRVNLFKYGFLLLSYWFERMMDPEIAKTTKEKLKLEKTSNQIGFNELINIFVFWTIDGVALIVIFIIELIYFYLKMK